MSLAVGNGTVTTTLQIGNNTSAGGSGSPLTALGQTAVSGSTAVAVLGSVAYIGVTGGIDVVDVSDPSDPKVLSSFATNDFPGQSVEALQVYNDELVVLTQNSSATGQSLFIYTLATPTSPTLLGSTAITSNGGQISHLASFSISNNHVYTDAFWYRFFTGSSQIFAQFGESVDIDISNPTSPSVVSSIYNVPPDPSVTYPDGTSGYLDGRSNLWPPDRLDQRQRACSSERRPRRPQAIKGASRAS